MKARGTDGDGGQRWLRPWIVLAAAVLVLAVPTASRGADGQTEEAEAKIRGLVEQLGHVDYAVRQHAQEQLARFGFQAYDALTAASTHEDLEVASRARYLLRLMRQQWATPKDPPEVHRLLSRYDLDSVSGRLARINSLVVLRGGAGLPALCRLIRFEKAPALSNQAAMAILSHEPVGKEARAKQAQLVRENLTDTRRPAAKWLLAYLKDREEPNGALAEWTERVEVEVAQLQRSAEPQDATVSSMLLYFLAKSQAARGQAALAEQTAQRALQLNAGREVTRLEAHLRAAFLLRRCGLFAWAEAEYRHVAGVDNPRAVLLAGSALAEMLHDSGKQEAAAEALRATLATVTQSKQQDPNLNGRRLVDLRARMYYFSACYWKEKGDRAKQVEFLRKSLREDDSELDSLIDYFHLPQATAEQQKEVQRLIEKTTVSLRERIVDEADDDSEAYNQFAWLVANTKGNLDEALSYSKRSLELSPNNYAYEDTLAHVYYAKGDYERAVEHQMRAVELDPHSPQICKKLDMFRAALESSRKRTAGP